MASQRKLIFTNDYYYHIYNRGIDRRPIFLDKRDHARVLNLLQFYKYANIRLRYSHFNALSLDVRNDFLKKLTTQQAKVEIVAYCLMPNHFHLLLKQVIDNGISSYMSNFTNAYTRYFDTKYKRKGTLLEGTFKAVFVESEEQLIHLTRYIHLNPVVGGLIDPSQLESFAWSSFAQYTNNRVDPLVSTNEKENVLSIVKDYRSFIFDHISYAKELHAIKHLIIEE